MPLRPPGALAALALLAVALAGCTAPAPAAEPPAAPAAELPPEGSLVSSAEAANASAEATGQSEFAKALDEKFHAHNYWGTGLEKLLMDEDVASGPLVPDGGPAGPFGALFRLGFARGAGLTAFEMPEGSIVPPETVRVEVAITWAASPTITGLRLAYQSAASKDLEFLDALPEGGGTYTVPTNLSMNDIPHTTVSKWRFVLLPHNDQGPGLFNGTVHVSIKAFREDTLFVAPPHPDFWGPSTSLALLEANGTLRATRAVVPLFLGDGDENFAFLEFPNGTIVPPHTGLLTLTLEWTNNAAAPDPFNIRPDLVYTPANTRRFIAPEKSLAEPGKAVYTIPVDAKMVDSPYAEQSGWAFFLFLASDNPGGQGGFFGTVGVFEGPFTLRVAAEREQLAA